MNFDDILKKLLASPMAGGVAGGLLSGGLLGALGNKHARKALGGAAKFGGAAAIGAVALAALQRYQAQQQAGAQAAPAAPRGLPQLERDASIVVQAMISAARADGMLDDIERARIGERLRDAGLGATEFDYVMAEFNAPADPHRIAALAQSEAEAAEIYAASLLALDVDHWAEQAYLQELKRALKLPDALAGMLEAEVKAPATG